MYKTRELRYKVLKIIQDSFAEAKRVDYDDFGESDIPYIWTDTTVLEKMIDGLIPLIKKGPKKSFRRESEKLLKIASKEEKLWLLRKLKRFEKRP